MTSNSHLGHEGVETASNHPYSYPVEHARRTSEAYVNLNANVDAKIKNPLLGIPRGRLMAQVDEFCREKGLDEYRSVIRKGALIAQDPTGYEDITGEEALDEIEIESLRDEVLHKWRVPNVLYLTIATCSIGAAVQGWDQTGSNGANLDFPHAYGIDRDTIHDKLLVGLVNAAPYIGTAFFGCWLSDPLNSRFGRRGTIFFSANFCLWPVIGSAFCDTWMQLLVCRLLLGVGMGTKASTGNWPFILTSCNPATSQEKQELTFPCRSSDLRCRKLTGSHSRSSRNELADVDRFRDILRHRRKRCRHQYRARGLEISAGISFYPRGASCHPHILVPRVAPLVYEEKSI